MIEVWHVRDQYWRDACLGVPPPFSAATYRHVATVECDDADATWRYVAFERTNTIERPWWQNDGVRSHVGPCRSTSVGDVVVVRGVSWVCLPVGWERAKEGVV